VLKIPEPAVDRELASGSLPFSPASELGTSRTESAGAAPDEREPVFRPALEAIIPAAAVPERPQTWTAMTSRPEPPSPAVADSRTIREYAYLLLGFALVPLVFSLLGKDEAKTITERIEATLRQATPEQLQRALPVFSKHEGITREDLLRVLPEGRLLGAHLPYDSSMHWVYGAITAAGFLLLTLAFFSVERAKPLHLLGIGLFTGTVGIVFLLIVQFCSQFRFGRIYGRGWFALILLILAFIGWSYRSALDPGSNFFLSALGFTFGVGLCEELTKAIPLLFYFHRDATMGWRGACLWGLASGIGFGVSEGIMYSANTYNGLTEGEAYVVRFVSCVALHAMWAASVGIAIARNLETYEEAADEERALFTLRVLAVPMVLHGLYDTLLKKDMNVGALLVALISFGWLAMQIERARNAQPGAGSHGEKELRPAY
jgi:RsiW-degrading membrane proteinase PrsW (M82 family)